MADDGYSLHFRYEVLIKLSWFSLYSLILALWVGGIAIFAFIITLLIFKSYPKDLQVRSSEDFSPDIFSTLSLPTWSSQRILQKMFLKKYFLMLHSVIIDLIKTTSPGNRLTM